MSGDNDGSTAVLATIKDLLPLFAGMSPALQSADTLVVMCRNITELRGLVPAATPVEIEAAARQYVRKVSGLQKLNDQTRDPFEEAVSQIAEITSRLLRQLPDRRQPPPTVPPLRRPEVLARIAARATAS